MAEQLSEKSFLLRVGRHSENHSVVFDDAVTINFKNMGTLQHCRTEQALICATSYAEGYIWIQCSSWWLMGLSISVAGMAYPAQMREFSGAAPWVVLVGTVWGLVGTALVLHGVLSHTSVLMETTLRRLRASGVTLSRSHVTISSFPLMRLLLCLAGTSMAFLLLVFISEVISSLISPQCYHVQFQPIFTQVMCAHRCSRGVSGVAQSLSPAISAVLTGAAFLSCLKNMPPVLPVVAIIVFSEVVCYSFYTFET